MNLQAAYNLLAEDGISDNCRYFAEVYKCFNFTDTDLLADYIDFIVHEPVHWMEGFPTKLQSKMSFSKPKTAVIKLLKKKEVHDALGSEVADAAHDIIWKTYKTESETMLAKRAAKQKAVKVEKVEEKENEENESSHIHMSTHDDTASIISSYESIPTPPLPLPNRVFQHVPHRVSHCVSHNHDNTHNQDPQQAKIDLLKSVLLSMSMTLPDGVSDAFRYLVDAV